MTDAEAGADTGLPELSAFAEERRRAATQSIERARPEFVLWVDYSEVAYFFTPPQTAIPLSQVDPQVVTRLVQNLYEAELKRPDLTPLLQEYSRDEVLNMTEEELQRAILRSASPTMTFIKGRFPLKNDFAVIYSIELNFESVVVRVGGPSQVAEAIITDVVEILWEAAGVKGKRWEDVSKSLVATAYGTSTRIDLGFSLRKLVHPALWDFMESDVIGGKNYAQHMGRQRTNSGHRASVALAATAVDELHIVVNTFNGLTGQSEQNNIRFSVMSRADLGSGRVRVTSTMHYDKHVEFLADLIEKTRP